MDIVHFERGRDGGAITRYDRKIAFPARSGVQPEPGDRYEVVSADLNPKGTVYFLTLGEKIERHALTETVELYCFRATHNNKILIEYEQDSTYGNMPYKSLKQQIPAIQRAFFARYAGQIAEPADFQDGIWQVSVTLTWDDNPTYLIIEFMQLLCCVYSDEQRHQDLVQAQREHYGGYSEHEFEALLKGLCTIHDVKDGDIAQMHGGNLYHPNSKEFRDVAGTKEEMQAYILQKIQEVKAYLVALPAVIPYSGSPSTHPEFWHSDKRRATYAARPGTPKELVAQELHIPVEQLQKGKYISEFTSDDLGYFHSFE